ncbi:MAG: pyroglutamyl-peptidase I [Pseudolabrys sp.]
MTTILVTGFGPYPGAPYNPTGPLVRALARHAQRGGARIVGHVFETSYATVDREMPKLLKQHKPDALLMFGLSPRTRHIQVETRARNTVAMTPDAARGKHRRKIADGEPFTLSLPVPATRLAASLRRLPVPARLSHDAGRYLCNYIAWRGAEAAATSAGPCIAAFVHIPLVRRDASPQSRPKPFTRARLERAGKALLAQMIALANQKRRA